MLGRLGHGAADGGSRADDDCVAVADPEYQKQLANAAGNKSNLALSTSPGMQSVTSSGLGSSAASNSSSSSSVSSSSSLGLGHAAVAATLLPAGHLPAWASSASAATSPVSIKVGTSRATSLPASLLSSSRFIHLTALSFRLFQQSPLKHLKLSPRSGSCPYQPVLSMSAPGAAAGYKVPGSPTRKVRGDTKKCRKVYGMEHRDQWCTQCKWKKACTRFGD